MPELIVRPARLTGADHELDAIVDLMTVALGDSPTRSKPFFKWKHLDNPFGRSFVWVAEHDGRLVALRAMMRWDLVSRQRRVRAVRAVDTATHPSHQRQGLFRRLTMGMVEALGAEGIDLIFNTPNDQSRPGYLKMGWREVGRPTVFISPGGRFRRRSSPQPGEVPLGAPLPHEARLHTPLDSTYLRWRYAAASGLDYHCVRTGDCAVFFRRRERGDQRELTLADLVIPKREDIPATARLVRQAVASTDDTYALAVASPRSREAAALVLAGFVPLPAKGPLLVVRRVPGQPLYAPSETLAGWRPQVGGLEVF